MSSDFVIAKPNDLIQYFDKFGRIVEVKIMKDNDVGFVEYEHAMAARGAREGKRYFNLITVVRYKTLTAGQL